MAPENPTGSGCLSMIFMIIVALFVGTRALTTPLVSDVPPTPSEAVHLQFDADAVTTANQQATIDIISQRLTALGITPDVQLYPATAARPITIRVLLPGGDGFQAALDLIRQPGDFELVDLSGLNGADYLDALIWTTHQAEAGVRPPDVKLQPETDQPFATILDNSHLKLAQAVADPNTGSWTIHVVFDQEGSGLLGVFTAAHISEPLAIVVDSRVLSAPIIQSMISGEAVITGNFTQSEARQLAAKIGFGALPVPLELISLS